MNYKQIYFNLIKKALQRESIDGYYETHHIIPRCLGGTDNKNNLVKLTAREHFVAHYLLVKIKPGNFKLINAAIMMSCTNKTRTTSRTYEWMKKKYALGKSELMKDPEHNSSFGTCWVYHTKEKESKRINKEDLQLFLDLGWKKGRVLNFDRCKVCECCKKEFHTNQLSKAKLPTIKYCSAKCRIAANRKFGSITWRTAEKKQCWVYDEQQLKQKRIFKNELESFLNAGWKRGLLKCKTYKKICVVCSCEFSSKSGFQKHCSARCSIIAKQQQGKLFSVIYQTYEKNKDNIIEWRKQKISLNSICKALGFSKAAGGYYTALKHFLKSENIE